MEDHSTNISKTSSVQVPAMRLQLKPIFIFSHYKSMENLSCHGNQSTYAMAKKKPNSFVEAWTFLQRFSFNPHIASEELIFMPQRLWPAGGHWTFGLSKGPKITLRFLAKVHVESQDLLMVGSWYFIRGYISMRPAWIYKIDLSHEQFPF